MITFVDSTIIDHVTKRALLMPKPSLRVAPGPPYLQCITAAAQMARTRPALGLLRQPVFECDLDAP
jgi:hypothetical protein